MRNATFFKKTLLRFVSFVFLLFLLPLLVGCLSTAPAQDEQSPVSTKPLPSSVTVTYAVCASGGGKIEGARTQSGVPLSESTTAVTAVAGKGYVFSGWSDGVKEETRTDVFSTEDTALYANFSFERMDFPIVSITTETGKDVVSKYDYIGATFSLCNTGNADHERSGLSAEIRGRGNGTWQYLKKSYRIKFTYKQNLLGLGTDEHRQWILMANHADRSLLRNYLAIYFINRLPGVGYNNNMTFVDLYLNGEYRGVYVLAEQIEDDAARVDIGTKTLDDPTVTDAGFLVELDSYAKAPNAFRAGGQTYEIKNEYINEEQKKYIRDYIRAVDKAIRANDRETLEAMVDIDSLVNGYIIEEYFQNSDAGWSSFFMHKKPGEKMVIGPLWDFDLSAANNPFGTAAADRLYVAVQTNTENQHDWYELLVRYPWITDAVRKRFVEMEPYIEEMLAELDRGVSEYGASLARNYEVWKLKDRRIYNQPRELSALDTWEEHAAYLRAWLVNRRNWLADYLSSDTAFLEYRNSQ